MSAFFFLFYLWYFLKICSVTFSLTMIELNLCIYANVYLGHLKNQFKWGHVQMSVHWGHLAIWWYLIVGKGQWAVYSITIMMVLLYFCVNVVYFFSKLIDDMKYINLFLIYTIIKYFCSKQHTSSRIFTMKSKSEMRYYTKLLFIARL